MCAPHLVRWFCNALSREEELGNEILPLVLLELLGLLVLRHLGGGVESRTRDEKGSHRSDGGTTVRGARDLLSHIICCATFSTPCFLTI